MGEYRTPAYSAGNGELTVLGLFRTLCCCLLAYHSSPWQFIRAQSCHSEWHTWVLHPRNVLSQLDSCPASIEPRFRMRTNCSVQLHTRWATNFRRGTLRILVTDSTVRCLRRYRNSQWAFSSSLSLRSSRGAVFHQLRWV